MRRVPWIAVALLCFACGKKEVPEAPPEPTPPPAVPLSGLVGADAPKAGATSAPPALPSVDRGRDAAPLKVVVATPQGAVKGIPRPTITFDKPVWVLGRDPAVAPAPASIEPAVKGAWRWLGSSTVEFVADAPMALSTTYLVKVPDGTKALDGGTLRGDFVFTFETPAIRPLRGEPVTSWGRFGWARPDQAFTVLFDQAPDPESLRDGLRIRGPGDDRGVKVLGVERLVHRLAREAGEAPDPAALAKDRRVEVRFQPETPLRHDTAYSLVFTRRLKGIDGARRPEKELAWKFATYGPLRVEEAGCGRYHGGCPEGPLTLRFSNRVTPSALKAALTIAPAVALRWPTGDEPRASFTLGGPFRPASSYRVTVAPLADEFGQVLAAAHTATLRTGDLPNYISFVDDRALLERDGRAALPLVHTNERVVRVGVAALSGTDAMKWIRKPWEKSDPPGIVWRDQGLDPRRNVTLRAPVDIGDAFEDVAGERLALVRLRWKDGRYDRKASTVVQITDLAIHLKTSPKHTAAWVWHLSTGAPAAGASVELLDQAGRRLAVARAGDDGVAKLPGVDGLGLSTDDEYGGRRYGPPFLMARASLGDDVGHVTTSDTWAFSPYRFEIPSAWESTPPQAEGLVFVDRGIYRPGEKVHVKGFLRHRSLGELKTPAGREVSVSFTDPEGGEIATETHTLSRFGGLHTSFTLPKDGRLGRYRVAVTDAEAKLSWSTSARMAEYRAPAFEVEVRAKAKQRHAGEPVEAVVEGRYLFGAAMSHAAVAWSMTAAPGRFAPTDADGYAFGRRYHWWDSASDGEEVIARGEASLDGEGRFEVAGGPAQTPKDRPRTYTVEASVTDVDRQVVAGRASFPVHPASFYLGVRGPTGFATKGEAFEVSVLARGAHDQERVAAKDVKLRLVRQVWNTVKKKTAWGTFETVSERQPVDVASCTVAFDAKTPASCTLTATDAGAHEIIAEATDAQGRSAVTTDSLWVVGSGYAAWLRDDDNRVEVVADKGTYDVGETARLLVQSPFPECEAWVTVEREGILWQKRMRLKGTATPIEIPVDASMIPNVFVGVVLARGRVAPGGKPGDPGRPAFRVGYRQIRVLKASKRLHVSLTPDAVSKRPGDTLKIDLEVKGHDGKGVESEVAVWAVDEGVLSLTGYEAPDPIDALYATRGLSIQQASNLTTLVPQLAYGEKGRAEGGGGGAAEAMSVRRRFETTPLFVGDATTDADGHATVSGTLPDNLTTFRLMAVALTDGDRAGRGRAKVVVSQPLLARPALPRGVRVGDRFAAGVVIHRKAGEGVVKVSAEVTGAVSGLEAMVREVTVTAERGREVRFPFEASGAGPATFRFLIEGAGERDAVEKTIPVRWPTADEVVATYGDTDGDREEAIEVPGGARPGTAKLRLTLASTALAGLGDEAKGLIDYPYGCLEQQTSRLVPFVALKSLLDRHGSAWLGKPAVEVVAKSMKKLAAMQRGDGGFGYWPGAQRSHYWGTAYAALAVEEARRAGYDTGEISLARARRFLKRYWAKRIRGEHFDRSPDAQAFGLYVLARAGDAQAGLEEKLYARRAELALFGRALLAASLARGGAPGKRAKAMVAKLMNLAKVEADTVHFAESDSETYAALFHSDTRSTAIVLQALLATDQGHAYVPRIARHLLEARRGGGYRNTQEAAFSLLALADFARIREPDAPDFTARVALGGRTIVTERFGARTLASVTKDRPLDAIAKGRNALSFHREGAGRLYYGARLTYAPAAVPRDAKDAGIVVQRWYTPAEGEGRLRAVTEGELVRVHLRLATHQLRHYVAVVDPLPAGLEAVDTTLATSARRSAPRSGSRSADGRRRRWRVPFDHSEMRDDRVLLFADRLPPGVHTWSYVARATTAGSFVMPPAHAEEMYTPEVRGRSEGGTFWIHPRAQVATR